MPRLILWPTSSFVSTLKCNCLKNDKLVVEEKSPGNLTGGARTVAHDCIQRNREGKGGGGEPSMTFGELKLPFPLYVTFVHLLVQ